MLQYTAIATRAQQGQGGMAGGAGASSAEACPAVPALGSGAGGAARVTVKKNPKARARSHGHHRQVTGDEIGPRPSQEGESVSQGWDQVLRQTQPTDYPANPWQ